MKYLLLFIFALSLYGCSNPVEPSQKNDLSINTNPKVIREFETVYFGTINGDTIYISYSSFAQKDPALATPDSNGQPHWDWSVYPIQYSESSQNLKISICKHSFNTTVFYVRGDSLQLKINRNY